MAFYMKSSPFKQAESYETKTDRFPRFDKTKDSLISSRSVDQNMARKRNKQNAKWGNLEFNYPKDSKTFKTSDGKFRVDTVYNKKTP